MACRVAALALFLIRDIAMMSCHCKTAVLGTKCKTGHSFTCKAGQLKMLIWSAVTTEGHNVWLRPILKRKLHMPQVNLFVVC